MQYSIATWFSLFVLFSSGSSHELKDGKDATLLKVIQRQKSNWDYFKLFLLRNISSKYPSPSIIVCQQVWEKLSGVNVIDAASEKNYDPEELARKLPTNSDTVKRIGFIGLGAMGFGMATHLLKSKFSVVGYDVSLEFSL